MIEVNKKHYGTWGVFMRPIYSKNGQPFPLEHDEVPCDHLETYLDEPNAIRAADALQEHDQKNDRARKYYVREVLFIDRRW